MESNTLQSLDVIKDIYNIDQLLSGKEYIRELVHRLATTLDVKFVMVGHAIEPERKSIQTDFLWAHQGFTDNVVYSLEDTPCTQVLCGTRVACFSTNVQQEFPKDQMLKDMNVQAYLGAPFLHTDGRLIGLLVIMDDKPFSNLELQTAIVEFFAARIGTEYRRLAAEDSLIRINESLERLVDERTSELQKAFASLQATQKQLISQEKLATIGRITFGIAHELKNPLNIIINASELLQDEDLDKESHLRAVEMIHQHSVRASEIITNMLRQARQDTSQEPEWINFSTLVDRALDMFLRSITDIDLKTALVKKINIAPQVQARLVDAPAMERVFINIIDNALYALNEKFQRNRTSFIPELQVELTPGKTLCRLSVRDNGTGIPQNHLPNVCDEFYTTKPPGEGTGLGLWIAKQNVEKNRGSFQILSKENEFTQITIELPSAPRAAEVSL